MKRQEQPRVRGAIILAGGEGSRLRELTRQIVGYPTPKQFCPVIGDASLLQQTRQRVSMIIKEHHIFTVVNRAHERFYQASLSDVQQSRLIVQPEARGTAVAIVYALLHAARIASMGSVAIFPSDHYIDDDEVFMSHVDAAFDAVEQRPEITVLLGITPDRPEQGYGWIEPGEQLAASCGRVFEVRRFWEKPLQTIAQNLMRRGCLWNSFVMVGRVSTLLGLVMMARPELYASFVRLRPFIGTPLEEPKAKSLYSRLDAVDFSSDVLAKVPVNLTVLPVCGVKWSDLGEPARVMETLARLGTRPRWAAA
jgi:mannose-1-phosphate guanylyltransferase